ncbi:unnamed protein product [Trypanosoma congolense IL3000]|uniref:WGS project CAEQ00000000 data, annotated contig 1644 n=1 Tax=Trypanosoma congolense (strain IL3000) TaxID=1068625 RepID=F9W7R3_TRYCI|nr:unnamed protein product [Trypanosoma congolense IL3000]
MLLSDLEGVEHTASCREDPKKQIPSMRGILYVCLCIFSLTLGTGLAQKNKNITLYLVRELALRGVGDVVLTARFSKNVNAYIRRHTDERVQTSVYSVAPDVMIVARAWFMGDPQNATDSYNTVSGIFDSWENQVDDILVSQLNNASLRELGVQPRIIELSDQCEYGDTIIKETSEDFGFNNLTLEINMTKVSEEDLLSRLCSVLAFTDCSLIVVDVTRKDYIYSTAVVTITSPNRNECLIMLMNNFRHASPMFPENIESVLVAQVEIYRRYGPNLTEVGMFQAPCSRRFWYLIFLLLCFH